MRRLSSSETPSQIVEKTLERWCQALKLEKLDSILRAVYANSCVGDVWISDDARI